MEPATSDRRLREDGCQCSLEGRFEICENHRWTDSFGKELFDFDKNLVVQSPFLPRHDRLEKRHNMPAVLGMKNEDLVKPSIRSRWSRPKRSVNLDDFRLLAKMPYGVETPEQ